MNAAEELMKRINSVTGEVERLKRLPSVSLHPSAAVVSSPPTAAQCTAAFGLTAAAAGRGFVGFAGTYLIYSDGTSWRWLQGTAAA